MDVHIASHQRFGFPPRSLVPWPTSIQGFYHKSWVIRKGGSETTRLAHVYFCESGEGEHHKGEQNTQLIKNTLLWVLEKVILSIFNGLWFLQNEGRRKAVWDSTLKGKQRTLLLIKSYFPQVTSLIKYFVARDLHQPLVNSELKFLDSGITQPTSAGPEMKSSSQRQNHSKENTQTPVPKRK